MEYRGINYLYLKAKHFEESETFLSYTQTKATITSALEQIQNSSDTIERLKKTLIMISEFQTLNNTINDGDLKILSKDLSNKINANTISSLQEAFEDAANQVVAEGGIDPSFAKIDFTQNVNIKQAIKDYSFQGLSSEEEMEEVIIKALYDNYKLNNKSVDAVFAKGYGYDEIITAIQKLKTSRNKEKGWKKNLQIAIDNAYETWKTADVQMKGAAQIKIKTKAHFLDLLKEKISNKLDIKISFKGEKQSMKSIFSETLIKNVYNIVDNSVQGITNNLLQGSARVTGMERENHIYDTLIYEYDSNTGDIKATASSQTLQGAEILKKKQIKTDVSIVNKGNPIARTNISVKFYDFSNKKFTTISLEDINIVKALDLTNQELAASYNNFFVSHEDKETSNYKAHKKLAIKYLSFLMLIRAWTGAGYNKYISENKIGPAGIFVAMDNTKSNIYMIDINKYLNDLFKNIENFDGNLYMSNSNELNYNTVFNTNNIQVNYPSWSERNVEILNQLMTSYRQTNYHMVIPKNIIQQYKI